MLDAPWTGRTEVRPGQARTLYIMSRIASGLIFRTLDKVANKVALG